MTPQSNSSPGGRSLPPRHRPNKSSLAKDTTEDSLWAFDDLDSGEAPAPQVEPAQRTLPPPRELEKPRLQPFEGGIQPKVKGGGEGFQVNVGKARAAIQNEKLAAAQTRPESTFDALDDWEEPAALATPVEAPVDPLVAEEPVSSPSLDPEPAELLPELSPTAPSQVALANGEKTSEPDEFSVQTRKDATPVSLRPRMGLSKLERVGLISLVALLVFGGGVIFFSAIGGLPSSSEFARIVKFPVKGKHLSALSASTFWRAPITTGPRRDTVRRGTELLPVITLSVQGGPAALRVFFRDSDGKVVGDAVTLAVDSDTSLELGATAGFEEAWMFDAYKTSDGKPWTIEVLEAPSINSPGTEFKRLFEMNVTSERR